MPPRVLIVDDNPQDRLLAKRALSIQFPDLEATEIRNQQELDEALAHPIDIVITDFQLRWTDGLEVLEASRRLAPAVPVVMFTNTGSEEVAASGLRNGLADYVVKSPTSFARLAHSVVSALHNAEIERRERDLVQREREALKLAQEMNRMKDEFLATISHELRTPLNAIRGWGQILQTPHDEETRARALQAVDRNTAILSRLIEDLVDESAIASGRLRLQIRPTDVEAVAISVIESLRPACAANGIEMTLTVMPDLAPVAADPDRLQQIVWNLLANSVKFTPKGGRVRVTVARRASSVELVVTDTGQGIRSDFLERVFERFSQEDAGTTRRHGGMGLGLSIVRQLVEAHGGTIAVESAGQGAGTTFTVRIPIAAARAAADAERTARTRLVGVHVLIVDNDRDTREVLAEILKDAGAKVTTAASAMEAFGEVLTHRPDVLVSDIGMPDEDGYSFIARLRGNGSERIASIPAVAVTAYGSDADRARALHAGFQFHLTKPVSISEFVAVVGLLANQTDDAVRR
jgi:signal transduction histidine kinase